MTEFLIKNILAEILFENRICESIEDQEIVNYLYKELLLERLLYGEPITIEELRSLLRQKIVNFEFIKLNGEIRPAKGTTMMKYVPTDQHPKGIRPSSPKVATFYDLDKKDWRSVSRRSKEIVLKKDEETGKPIVMVKDKNKVGDVAVKDKGIERVPKIPKKPEQPEVTVSQKPIDQVIPEKPPVEVKKVKPIESTKTTEMFHFVNPVTGASEDIEMTPKDAIKQLKKLGPNWRLADEEEYNRAEEAIKAAVEKEPDILNIGDKRNYLNRLGKNVEIEIIREDPQGGICAHTADGAVFKIPPNRIKNIGQKIVEKPKTKVKSEDIINKDKDLENIEADVI